LEATCPFCRRDTSRVFLERDRVFAIWDGFPVSDGHALIVPYRHVADWLSASDEERAELSATITTVCEVIRKQWGADGFNIGINIGSAAGQTVPHLHVHVIPRRAGDVPDPRGGVRHVIPGKGNYLLPNAASGDLQPRASEGGGFPDARVGALLNDAQHGPSSEPLLTTGPDDPLIKPLERDLADAMLVEMAVAFVLRSGAEKLLPHLRDLLDRGGKLRFLTGDYLDVTDPDALQSFVDLQRTTDENRCQLRIFQSSGRSFHPKAYLTTRGNSTGVAYVGSSNISNAALVDGVEWNFRVTTDRDRRGWYRAKEAFQRLFDHTSVVPLTDEWIRSYRVRREAPQPIVKRTELSPEPPLEAPTRNVAQQEALDRLEASRLAGNQSGLVVMATGVGKTWLAAFDSMRPENRRVLFVAHREEILKQALATFRRFGPGDSLGLYIGNERAADSRVLFASIQTLSQRNHLNRFKPDEFDYIVIDEFHHAAANTYRRIIDYFQPKFLLGLTATPERADGGDLLALCDENLVYRCNFVRGIELDLLCSFRYFGVPDDIDYTNIPWRNQRFDEEALTTAAATEKRAANVLEQWEKRKGDKTIAFCVSRRHANFMRSWFRKHNVPCAAVHSGEDSDPRALSLEQLESGELKVVFAVDMFNEGVDIPAIDTVLMLRPTESQVIWLQQFGRGLRKHGDKVLSVIDYIGNHKSFLVKVRALLDLAHASRHQLLAALLQVERREFQLPPNCEVTYELAALDILKSLLPQLGEPEALRAYYGDFRDRHGQRPTAVEAFHDGYLPQTAREHYGSWFGFVDAMGELDEEGRQAMSAARAFMVGLETTSMTRSYKMLVLQAMLSAEAMPGQGMTLTSLAESFAHLAGRSARLRDDVAVNLQDRDAVTRLVRSNPVAAWIGTGARRGEAFFRLEGDVFQFIPDVAESQRPRFRQMVRELVDWRLAQYLTRSWRAAGKPLVGGFVAKVSHSGGRPIIFLPDRSRNPGIPSGEVVLSVDGQDYVAKFVRVAINVVRRSGAQRNELPSLLRGWFGNDAGLPGTDYWVRFTPSPSGLIMAPADKRQSA